MKTGTRQAESIVPVRRHEAALIAARELDAVLHLLEQLDGDDWTQPTDCSAWNVQNMAAHLAGACAGWAHWRDFRRQILMNPYIRTAEVPVDAINRRQLEDRADKTPSQLGAELREAGPKAIRIRKNLPGILRRKRIDAKPMPGKMSIGYLVDVIYVRDQWMHRMDICRATGKNMVIAGDHDGRLLDLVMLDIAKALAGECRIVVNVAGPLIATYLFGHGEAQAELDIDFFTLNRRASMRISAEQALQTVSIRGDRSVATGFLRQCEILY